MDDQASVKERILAAALHEFELTGYHGTSLRTIVERSGSNKPMIYYHFQGKEGLYLAAARRVLEQTAEELRAALAPPAPALTHLRRFAEVYLGAFLISRPVMGTMLRELDGLSGALARAIADEHGHLLVSQLRRVLATGVEQGEFRRLDLDGCLNGIMSLLLGFVRFHRAPADQVVRAALAQLLDYYALGLLSREALAAHVRGAITSPAEH